MKISRRTILGLFPFFAAGFVATTKAEAAVERPANQLLGYQLHDDHNVFLLKEYARSLALKDERARSEAQKMFHKGELLVLDNQQVTGYGARLRWKAFVEAHEAGNKPPPFCRNGG